MSRKDRGGVFKKVLLRTSHADFAVRVKSFKLSRKQSLRDSLQEKVIQFYFYFIYTSTCLVFPPVLQACLYLYLFILFFLFVCLFAFIGLILFLPLYLFFFPSSSLSVFLSFSLSSCCILLRLQSVCLNVVIFYCL